MGIPSRGRVRRSGLTAASGSAVGSAVGVLVGCASGVAVMITTSGVGVSAGGEVGVGGAGVGLGSAVAVAVGGGSVGVGCTTATAVGVAVAPANKGGNCQMATAATKPITKKGTSQRDQRSGAGVGAGGEAGCERPLTGNSGKRTVLLVAEA